MTTLTSRLFERLQMSRSHLPLIGIDQRESVGETECGTSQDEGMGEGTEPVAEGLHLIFEYKPLHTLLDQANGLFERRSGQGMRDSFREESVLFVPATGTPVQC